MWYYKAQVLPVVVMWVGDEGEDGYEDQDDAEMLSCRGSATSQGCNFDSAVGFVLVPDHGHPLLISAIAVVPVAGTQGLQTHAACFAATVIVM